MQAQLQLSAPTRRPPLCRLLLAQFAPTQRHIELPLPHLTMLRAQIYFPPATQILLHNVRDIQYPARLRKRTQGPDLQV